MKIKSFATKNAEFYGVKKVLLDPKIPYNVSFTNNKTVNKERMLAIPEIHHIKHLRENEGLSFSKFVCKTVENSFLVRKN